MPDSAQQARRVLLASLVITGALYVIPFGHVIGYPLVLLSTYVHEMGHGLAAILTGGDFVRLQVFGDGSGVATTATSGGRFVQAVVSGGGLVGPAVAAGIGFTVGRRAQWARIFLLAGGLLLLITALLWVRTIAGWIIAIGLVVVSIAIALIKQERWSQLWLVFLSVQLSLSVFSRGDYLFARSASTGAGLGLSDSEAMSRALFLPYWFWGVVCGLFSLAVLGYGAWLYLRHATRDLSVDDGV